MSQQLTGTPPMGMQASVPVTKMMQAKTATKFNWKYIAAIAFVAVVIVLCLTFIPGAPIYNALHGPDKLKTLVPPNDPNLPSISVLASIPSMRNDGNYLSVVNGYKADTGFGGNRNTAIVIVGNFITEFAKFKLTDLSPQAFNDAKLYKILASATVSDAITAIKA